MELHTRAPRRRPLLLPAMRRSSSRAVPVSTGTHAVQVRDVRGARVVLGTFPALQRLPRHLHERAMVSVVIGGRFCERFGGREHDCRPGTVLTKPGLESHDDVFSRDGSRQVIVEPEDLGSELMRPSASLFESVRSFDDGRVEAIARRLAWEVEHSDPVSELAIEALALELIATAVRRAGSVRGSGAAPPTWLRQAREVLHDRWSEPLHLDEVARVVGVHPAYLARLFRRHFGLPMGAYVRRLRLDRAAVELQRTDEPISAIAVRHGFSDQSHFTRLFKRHMGLTPLQHRRAREQRPR